MARSLLQIVMDVVGGSKAARQVDDVTDSIDELNDEASQSSEGFGNLGAVVQGAMAAFAVQQVADFAAEMLDLGITAERAETALIAYSGSALEADRTTRMVQMAAGGAISELEAMQNASRLMAMGLATNAEEAAKLTEIAVTLGASMGKGPNEAFEEFALLLANQSLPRLDTFGISSGRVRQRVDELTSANKNMTRETAFMTAVIEDAEGKLVELEEAGFEAASGVDEMRARWEDLRIELADEFTDVALPVIDILLDMRDKTRDLTDEAVMGALNWQEYSQSAALSRGELELLTQEEFEARRQQIRLDQALQAGATTLDTSYVEAVAEAAIRTGELATSTDTVSDAIDFVGASLSELSNEVLGREALDALNNYTGELDEFDRAEYASAFRDIANTFDIDLTPAQIEAQIQLADLKTRFGDITREEFPGFIEGLENIARLLGEISDTEINVNFDVGAAGGGGFPINVGTAGGGDIGQNPGGGGR